MTGRPVLLATAAALVPAGSGTQLSMSVSARSYVSRLPLNPSFCQRHSCPLPHAPRAGGAATAAGSVRARAPAVRTAAVTTVRVVVRVVVERMMVIPPSV